jgi:signal transduction histidine kinase
MPEAVVVLDRKQNFDLHNRAAQALNVNTGRVDPCGEPLSLDIRYASGQPVPPAELPIERALLRGERVLGAELAIVGPTQRWIPIVASATPVLIDGEIAGAVGVFQDISQLKELERQREEWTSIVAHDLRQPVNTIAFALEALVARDPAETKESRLLERIRRAVQSLERMIGDLLDASRLESHRLEIEREAVDVRAMLEEVWTSVAELRDRHVRLDVPASTPQVFADQVRLADLAEPAVECRQVR